MSSRSILLIFSLAASCCGQDPFVAWRHAEVGDWASYRFSEGSHEETWSLKVQGVAGDSLLLFLETSAGSSHAWVAREAERIEGSLEDIDGETYRVLRDTVQVTLPEGWGRRVSYQEARYREGAPASGLVLLERRVVVELGDVRQASLQRLELLQGGSKPEPLAASLEPEEGAELEAGSLRTPGSLVLTLNRPSKTPLEFEVWAGRPELIDAPSRVEIPAGETRARFELRQQPDARLSAVDRRSRVLVTGHGVSAAADVTVPMPAPIEPLRATLEAAPDTALEDGLPTLPAVVRVLLNRSDEADVELVVLSGRPEYLEAPSVVRVPAGELSASFTIAQKAGALPDMDDRTANVFVAGAGMHAQLAVLLQPEIPLEPLRIELLPDETAALEDGLPRLPVFLQVRLSRPLEEELMLDVWAGRPDLVEVDSSLRIAAGKTSYTFKLSQRADIPVAEADRHITVVVGSAELAAALKVLASVTEQPVPDPEPAPPQNPPADTGGS